MEMPAGDDQVLNKQQSISSSTSTGATRATSPSPDSSSQDTKPPSPAEARAAGRKRALLCGVTNKADPENHLRGSVNDVNRIKEMLIKKQFGYPNNDECIRVLIDDQEIKGNKSTPTKKNIVDSLEWLVKDSKSGDKLVFFFSGHCCRPDSENTNILNIGSTQSIDLCCCPKNKDTLNNGSTQSTDHDHVYLVCTGNDLIPNCYINSTIVRPLKEGVTLYAIVDSCFSGRILDLKYTYDQERKDWDDNYETPSKAEKGTKDNYKPDLSKADQKDASGGLAICLSATNNRETAESNANSGGNEILGTMTVNLTKMVKKNVTYADILKKMHELHAERCSTEGGATRSNTRRVYAESRKIEVPVLSSSRKFDVSSQKFLL
ncbi:hypothetical protein I3842_06G155300 [Carya illinoinensis]|uniref:Peptidase C14 caspase domain-containing protein n=1 Tax=Carya illinoinensis TaxID=32201 RepID=A0A922EWE0_CARIL|nr:hypothetical protein I3842_06G155300 [Carya illinoinensis]